MNGLDRTASVFLSENLSGFVGRRHAIPILMYHSISIDSEPGVSAYYRLTTSPSRFVEHMTFLHDKGYQVTGLPEALGQLAAGPFGTERRIVLTFDDGFKDFSTDAWPILTKLGFSATVFLATAFVGARRRYFKGRECLTWSEIRELQDQGASFGAHTVNHPTLYGLPWTTIRTELRDSRLQLEDELHAPVRTFAYPFAFPQEDRGFVGRFKRELIEEGYQAAVTTAIGRARPGSDLLCLKRLPINDADDQALLNAKLSGAYDWVGRLQFLSRCIRRGTLFLNSAWHSVKPPLAT